jgi:hypothetical protein
MKHKRLSLSILALVLVLAVLFVGFASAQDGDEPREQISPAAVDAISNYIPIQGRLTDSAGHPLDGNYLLTFRLYDVSIGGTALCEYAIGANVDDGLFSTYIWADGCPIDGRQLYLGLEVGEDGEMTPRRYIDNVPYAWSLRPGAEVEYNLSDPLLYLANTGDGEGLWSSSASGEGVHGASLLGAGVAGYGIDGPGVYGESLSGPAISAKGPITSTEPSYLWISGNGVRPFNQTDSTIINMTNYGGAEILRGAETGNKHVMLPITIPGTLYGQPVRLTGLDLYWKGSTDLDGITAVLFRRQTGVCWDNDSSCFMSILHNLDDRSCDDDIYPDGCTVHFDLTTNNVLSSNSGILYLTIEFSFASADSPINFGGARLTLEYQD